jgi:azurin
MKDDPKDAVNGKSYADMMIEQYDNVKENVNILKVVKDSPHFTSMLNAIIDSESILEHSFSIKMTRDLASKVLDGVSATSSVSGTTYNWLHRNDRMRTKKTLNSENKYFDTVGYSLTNDE